MRHPSVLTVLFTLIILFLYAPIVVVVIFAFNGGANLSLPLHGLSFRWFRLIFLDPAFRNAFANSLKVALAAAFCSGIVGTAAAFVFARRSGRVVRSLEALSRLPVMLPPLFLGISMLTTIAAFSLTPSLLTVLAGHIVYTLPYIVVVVAARLRSFELGLEDAARDLGARPWRALQRITVPIILPAILGAAMLAFAYSFDEVLMTTFIIGGSPTLPTFILSRMRYSVDPSINAVATILLTIPWVAGGVAWLIMRASLVLGRAGAITDQVAPTVVEG